MSTDHTVSVSFGAIGSKGRTITQQLEDAAVAEEVAQQKASAKLNEGYSAIDENAEMQNTEDVNTTKRSSRRSSKRTKAEAEVEDEENDKNTTRSSRRNSKRAKAEPKSEENKENEEPETKSKNAKTTTTKSKSKSKPKKTKAEPETAPAEEEGNDDEVSSVSIPVDDCYRGKKATVVGKYDATLNQTNIMDSNNNNKFYRIQMLKCSNTEYYVWTRWGRVGDYGQTANLGPYKSVEEAKKMFEKKFRDKTANQWSKRANFVPKNKKYVLLEIDYEKVATDEPFHDSPKRPSAKKENVEYLPSKLDLDTKDLVDMLFEKDMYEQTMAAYDFDTRRMPLGQLSEAQVLRGVELLQQIEEILRNNGSHAQLPALSSRFYSELPHDFGRRRPPVINTLDMLQQCFDKCNILLDIEKANQLMEAAEKRREKEAKKLLPYPADAQYDSLGADLTLVDKNSTEYKRVFNAFVTTGNGAQTKLLNVWRVNRHGEEERFAPYAEFDNKKCLWHGTNIAVVAAILSSGLRIMPHSGGRVGRGIYLASECGKSQGYTSPSYSRNTACMFLAEAALGKEFDLLHDDSSLKKAPEGFDSVVARGNQTPAKQEPIEIDGSKVLLPTGQPKNVKKYESSSFFQDEYLVYREEQVRLRYVITVDYGSNPYW